ncbi:MAG: hypothetical protein J5486_07165 [Bacteroidaceae bacterium]|nr:hypothetical protein [Bacteroidaceae bacterium]
MDKPLRLIVKVQPLTFKLVAEQDLAPQPRLSTINAVRSFARQFRPL